MLLAMLSNGCELFAGELPETREPREFFFTQTFGDLPEELKEARQAGKLGIFLFFEQEGCDFCARMMQLVLNQPQVQEWYSEHFVNIAVDIRGDVELRDVDGITLPAKVFAEHRKVKFTPVMSFLDLNGVEVFRKSGMVADPEKFLLMGNYIAEQRYTDTSFKDYLAEKGLDSSDQAQLPLATDLRATGVVSATDQLVILVAATREGCSYCALLKREILLPMLRSGEYEQRILVRELVIEPETDVIDFDGHTVSSSELAARYSVKITPTVLLLDNAGKPLHSPLTGINTAEMYGFYLDRAIDQAVARLRSPRPIVTAQE